MHTADQERASLRRIHSPPFGRSYARRNQARAEGARAGNAARLTNTHVVRKCGGAVVIKGTGAALTAATSFKRSVAWMRSVISTICICGIAAKTGTWLWEMVSLGQSGRQGASDWCSVSPQQSQCCSVNNSTPKQHTEAGTMSASRASARSWQRRFIRGGGDTHSMKTFVKPYLVPLL